MKVYAVRHIPSGLFIPRLKTGYRRGGSHLEPSNEREPRIFHNYRAASAFLCSWVQGVHFTSCDIDSDPHTDVKPVPSRKKDEMEIVEFNLVETSDMIYTDG
jgi:hypothetical protein